ncbi:MAG: transglutaminaseTgpA domain-containing protein [Myxococcales bacterium]
MSFGALQKVVTYLLAALGLCALSFGGELSPASLAALGVGFVASWFAEGPWFARPAWSRLWSWLMPAALALQVARGLFFGDGWLALTMEFAGLLTISRLSNRRNAADYQQIAMLAFVQLIAATVLTTDLGYAVLFVAFVIVTPWVLTFAHLRREIERNYPPQADARGGTDLARVLSSKRIVGAPFLLWTLLLSVPMLLMTLGLFVIFPRVGLGMLSFGSSRGQHMAGFGNNIELGQFGVIRDDPTVVIRLTPDRPLTPREEARYLRLRGTAFDRYDGRIWTRSSDAAVPMARLNEYFALRRMGRPEDRIFKLILERLDEPVLFLPHGSVGVRIPHRGLPGGPREKVELTRGHGFDLRFRAPEDIALMYDAVVSTDLGDFDVPLARDLDDDRYLALPPGHERVYALARELTKDLSDPREKAARLLTHLRDGGRYRYSTDMPDVGSKPPLEVFLFEARRGHCEYFATALAIMLRAVGIPSRNVTGFLGGKYNPYGGYYGIRQSDAHSWVEAQFPERGWVTLDPTPASRYEVGPNDWLVRDLSAMVDAARAYWMTKVVSYDVRAQIRFLREMQAFLREIKWPSLEGIKPSSGPADGARNKNGDAIGQLPSRLAMGLAVIVVLLLVWRALRRRAAAVRALPESARRAQALYRELERALAKQGKARPIHVSPEAHARALEREGFPTAPQVRELTDAYTAARYGGSQLSRERVAQLQKRLSEVKRAA